MFFSNLFGSIVLLFPILLSVSNETEFKNIEYLNDKKICNCKAYDEGIKDPCNSLYELKDLDGNRFYVQVGINDGFMVYDPISKKFLEKSKNLVSPYNFNEKWHEYYYFGPFNYYERINNNFISLTNDNVIDIKSARNYQKTFNDYLEKFREVKVINHVNSDKINHNLINENNYYIDNYKIIKESKIPKNNDNSCGYIAASLILNFWDKTMHSGTVRPQFLDSNGDLISTDSKDVEHNLKDKLVELSGGNPKSWALPVKEALLTYCNEYAINGVSSYDFLAVGAYEELRQGRPFILFGDMPNLADKQGRFQHAVVCYGMQKDKLTNYYIVHYGYNNMLSEVVLEESFIASITRFKLFDYEHSYNINPSDYKFPDAYCGNEVEQMVHTSSGLSFNTKRLRTGYIQNQYITMSPRRQDYGTAYIDYYFKNPVLKLKVDLSFWSGDERYNKEDNPEAIIQYYKLTEDYPTLIFDMLEANLTINRENQRNYEFSFPNGTKHIRFYTHFERMSGYTDRNKGRICIGPMEISTYW